MSNNRNRNRNRPVVGHTNGAPVPFVLTDEGGDEFAEREPLFSISGQVYTIPVRVPAGVGVEYALTVVERGAVAAIIYALNYCLGEDGRRALLSHRTLKDAELQGIIAAIRGKFDGSMTGPKAPPKTA